MRRIDADLVEWMMQDWMDDCKKHGEDEKADILRQCINIIKDTPTIESGLGRPLTMQELRNMNGEMVYCLELNVDAKVIAPRYGLISVSYTYPGTSGTYDAKELTLYRRRPNRNDHGEVDG